MRRLHVLIVLSAVALGLLAVPTVQADEPGPAAVPEPTVVGPVPDDIGIKGEPWFDPPFVLAEAEPYPYVSEEFFVEGTARDLLGSGADAAYRTRMLVVRPASAADFTGTVVVEWDNVTAQAALNPLFIWDHPYLLREGHAFVSVSAQKVGVDGPSPLAHTQWDPPRYGTLVHPGDAYSYDIYAQAIEALRQDTVATPGTAGSISPTPVAAGGSTMGGLEVTNVIATGTSQSASRLHNFLDDILGIHLEINVDGVLLDAGGSRAFGRSPVIPTIHFLSEDGLSATTPNAGGDSLMGTDDLYRLWEVPAASHADAEFSRYIEDGLYLTHILEAPPLPWKQWDDRRYTFTYGDDGPTLRAGCQPLGYGDNTYPRRYAARAAMDQLIRWTAPVVPAAPAEPGDTGDAPWTNGEGKKKGHDKNGKAATTTTTAPPPEPFVPDQPPRVSYDATGQPVRDANRQIVGGVRLPQIDVPVADYLATTCGLFGHTVAYDPLTLSSLYPTTAAYVAAMDAAIERALDAGSMLPADADELRVQLETAATPGYRAPTPPGDLDEGVAHFLAALAG